MVLKKILKTVLKMVLKIVIKILCEFDFIFLFNYLILKMNITKSRTQIVENSKSGQIELVLLIFMIMLCSLGYYFNVKFENRSQINPLKCNNVDN